MSLRDRAIALMKEGRTADEVHTVFVWEGHDPNEVRAVLTELAALQRQAAAMDPARLRGEAQWMLSRGASVEDVVAHFARAGIAEVHARPEAERIAAALRAMRPCQRCGAPTPPRELVFDLSGFSICNRCNLSDEIHRSEQRGILRDIEVFGALGGVGPAIVTSAIANAMDANVSATTHPFCPRCAQPSGVLAASLPPEWRARVDPTSTWVCRLCGVKLA